MTALLLLFGCIGVLLALMPVALLWRRFSFISQLVYVTALIASTMALAVVSIHLLSNPSATEVFRLPLGLPWLGAHFRLDSLSAFFLVVVNLGGATASLYGLGYGRHEESPQRVLPFFVLFLVGMNLVVLADDAFTFLLSWEFMSLTSWALVLAHHRQSGNLGAGYVYLLMAGFGTLTLLLAFGLMAGPDGGFGFGVMRSDDYSPGLAGAVLILTLLGAGSKAGIVPLHVWLPLAHPAAPSHVSALMSGVMTKVAVYGFIRIVFDLLGPPAWWWSAVVLVIGGLTAVIGVLYALMQHDLKRLLAYHTVENIGIIFIGLGLALGFEANGLTAFAALALTAALFHVLNHSLFKSLLFFGAGAVLTATGERDMERLGGLIHRMPVTAFAFLVGSVAISALPPLNGFVSEWLTFQAILVSTGLPQWTLKLLIPAVGAMLALSAALAAACFAKAFGITFLGRSRSANALSASETDRMSLAAMGILVLLCLMAGIFPGQVIDALAPLTRLLVDGSMPLQSSQAWLTIVPIRQSLSSYNGLLVMLFIVTSASLSAYVIHRVASRKTRRGPAWDCGFPDASTNTQYTAGSFAQPIRRVFASSLFQVREQINIPPQGSTAPASMKLQMRDLIWEKIFAPIEGLVAATGAWLNHSQFLTIRKYLTLVLVSLVLLLIVVALWR
jgi:formate hydrogenlyase subunit 3/multisubunit Na+/H+ antiporter MnhD subunit